MACKNNNKDTGRGCAAKSMPRDSSISVDVIILLGGTAQTGDNEANNNKSVVEPQIDNSPGANIGVPSGETALTDDNDAPTVPTTETDNTPVTTNNTVDNEPAEIQNLNPRQQQNHVQDDTRRPHQFCNCTSIC